MKIVSVVMCDNFLLIFTVDIVERTTTWSKIPSDQYKMWSAFLAKNNGDGEHKMDRSIKQLTMAKTFGYIR